MLISVFKSFGGWNCGAHRGLHSISGVLTVRVVVLRHNIIKWQFLPCMFLGMSPCSPYDRERPRDSVSTLGSMSALPAWAGDSATLGGTPGHERRAVPPQHAAKCPDSFTAECLSYCVSSIPTTLWKKQTGCLHTAWPEPLRVCCQLTYLT